MRTAHTNRTDEPIKIRYKKLSDGKSSIYLDTYINGKRSYEFLKLYLYPGNDKDVAAKNEETKRQAELIKQSRLSKLSAGSSVTSDVIKADSLLQEKDVTANVVNETPQKEKKKRNRVAKEIVTLREKELASGKKSLYLDIYHDGTRTYEFLKLYIMPENTDLDRQCNVITRNEAIRRKEERLKSILRASSSETETEVAKESESTAFDPDGNKCTIAIRNRKMKNGGRSIFLEIRYKEQILNESLELYFFPDTSEAEISSLMSKAKAIRKKRIGDIKSGTFTKKGPKKKVKDEVDRYKEYLASKKSGAEIAVVNAELKRSKKVKEPVRVRFKPLSNGNQSVYLAINVNGRRTYDYLQLYLVPEVDASAKMQNKATMEAVYAIKAQRILDITNGAAGIRDKTRKKIRLIDWLAVYRDAQVGKGHYTVEKWVNLAINVVKKKWGNISLGEADREFCNDFMMYMLNDYITYKNTKPSKTTVHNYLKCLKAAFNLAVEEEILSLNPIQKLDMDFLKGGDTKREFLTVDEVKRLMETPCGNESLKNAFLFSCFCGLRISDVRALKWKNVIVETGQTRVEITQYKTKRPLYLPLNRQALKYMPERGDAGDDDPVFSNIPVNSFYYIDRWAKSAKIAKHVTFHVSRHTFATMELTMGADLYTTSKLLGHTDIRNTQIYAKIVNSKKVEAVSLLDSAFV